MKDKENKKKYIKLIAIGIMIIAIILLIAVSTALIFVNKKEEAPIPVLTDEQAIDYFYNNYLISYLIEGDVQVGEGTLTVKETGEKYSAVSDEKLKNISSSEDITDLVIKTLRNDDANKALDMLADENYNNYVTVGGQLYIKKTSKICKENLPDVNKKGIVVDTRNEKLINLSYENYPNMIYFDDIANQWFMPFLTYGCDD